MKTITLELLRHGPPHNQLLSPLTQYLALCENHAAVTLHVPFEHNQFLHRLQALGYDLGDEPRAFQLKDTARVLGEMLGQVPGLIAELNRSPGRRQERSSGGESARMTHLRLVISASELALLPFELALAPQGFPGAGQQLLLQSDEPICLIREVRRVAEQYVQWPNKPRILFVAASPPGVGPIPMESHLLALRQLVHPWVDHYNDEDERREQIAKHLVLLPNVTAEALETACADGSFTHVHILAHGIQYRDGYDVRFGLAFHNPNDPQGEPDIVSGERLATIIGAAQRLTNKVHFRPVVVTLASCNSGNVGSVAGAGSSVAHALHESGVPMVIAGQFPLSFPGSVLMVEVLYRGLLWGEDPRVTLSDLRRRLHSQLPDTHDWVSITAYASLSPEFEKGLTEVQIAQTMRGINVAMNYADRTTAKMSSQRKNGGVPLKPEEVMGALDKIDAATRQLETLVERTGEQRDLLYGLLASTEKRRGEVYFFIGDNPIQGLVQKDYLTESRKSLLQARRCYWEAFLLDRSNSWAPVQYLSLDIVLRHVTIRDMEITAAEGDERNAPKSLWTLAHVLSLTDLGSAQKRHVEWAYGNLVELYLLGMLIPEPLKEFGLEELKNRAGQRARDLVNHAGPDSFEVYSTRRQILRYVEWYSEMAPLGQLVNAAKAVLDLLPETDKREWV
jgi:hypothetical protein